MSNKKFAPQHLLRLIAVVCFASATQLQAAALIPSPPEMAVKSYILMDVDSREVLASEKPDEMMHPASLTKMMTSYIADMEMAAGNISSDDKVLVSKKAWGMGGSTMFIEVGERIPVKELLKGIIIVSGNDASVAMAEHIAGSEDSFVDLMNNTASKLGMSHSNFQNSSGWPAKDHYSTARDLALLGIHIIQDYPEYYSLYAEKYYQYGIDKRTGQPLRRQANRNRLLWTNPNVDGLKTGHIEATGYHLAVTAKQNDRRLIAVLLGAGSERQRADDAQKLLTYGFRFFENVDVKRGNETLETVKIWKGQANELDVGIANDLVVTVPREAGKNLKATMIITPDLEAPIAKGQQVGTMKVTLDESVVKEVPVIARNTIERGGFLKCLWDSIAQFFAGLLS